MASAIRVVSQQYSPALNLLIVNDDRWIKEACKAVAEKLGYTVNMVDSAVPALLYLSSHPADVVLVDAAGVEAEALELAGRIRKLHPRSEVALVGASAEGVSSAAKGVELDCLRKPFQTEELRALLEKIALRLRARRDGSSGVAFNTGASVSSVLVGQAPEMQKLLRIASTAGSSRNPVLIVGESGTGKEKLARSIHAAGAVQGAPFVPVDCASPDPAMIEASLFPNEQTSDGTIFLDEVAALSLELQGKLVRALQDRMVRLPERSVPTPFEARLIAASQHDLEPAVRQGAFRRDLYLRLNVLSLRLPPLRERKGDIPGLIEYTLAQLSQATGRSYTMSHQAMKLLLMHDWPGNVTELQGCVQRAAALSSGSLVQVDDLPAYLIPPEASFVPEPAGDEPEIVPLAELEKKTILTTLQRLNGDKIAAARLLGIGKTTLYRKLREYGIAGRSVSRPTIR